jgi:hypothetical protein
MRNKLFTKSSKEPQTLTSFWINGLTEYRYVIWNVECKEFVKGLPLMTVSKELSKYKLELVGVQEVRWEGGGTEPHIFLQKRE